MTPDLTTVTVRAPRLVLRPYLLDDVEEIAAACVDPLIQHWLPALPSPYTLDDARTFVTGVVEPMAAGTDLMLAVVGRGDGRLVGSIGLHRIGDQRGHEIGYWIAPWGRAHRYAAEATDALARWAHAHGMHRVHLLAATANVASCRTAELAGFLREGVLRESHRDRAGGPQDMAVYSRLATDPAPAMLSA